MAAYLHAAAWLQVDGQAWVRDVPWLDPAGAVATDVVSLASFTEQQGTAGQ